MPFDATGCNEVLVRTAGGSAEMRQGNEDLRAQLTDLVS
jgi:hypothetical protein